MDLSKKRKLDDNGILPTSDSPQTLTPSDARKLIERFTPDQLLHILQHAVVRHPDVLDAVRSIADPDVTQRKLFIRGLGWETTSDSLRSLFSSFGPLDEAIVILDKASGKSKGYGFVTFTHVDSALLALKEPSKKIDGRITVTQLAAAGNAGNGSNSADIAARKIYVANVPPELPAEKLLAHFSLYGEIEEGPLGFDKQTGKSKGFALFVYKTADGAQAALVDPVKTVEGRQLNCKLAMADGKPGKRGGPGGPNSGDGSQGQGLGSVSHGHGDGNNMGLGPPSSMAAGSVSGQYGMGSSYGGYGGQPQMGNHPLSSSTGVSSVGSQVGSGPYGGVYGGPGSTGYGAGGGGGFGGGSLYRMPGSGGMPSGGYQDGGHYGLSSVYPNQHHQPTGASPVPRVPPGAMYPNVPPYY